LNNPVLDAQSQSCEGSQDVFRTEYLLNVCTFFAIISSFHNEAKVTKIRRTA